MIAGRLRWRAAGAKPLRRACAGGFEFDAGALLLTEAGTKRRASLHLVRALPRCRRWTPAGSTC